MTQNLDVILSTLTVRKQAETWAVTDAFSHCSWMESGKCCSLPLEEVFISVLAFPWIWFLQTFGQISAHKKLVRKKKNQNIAKAHVNIHLPEDLPLQQMLPAFQGPYSKQCQPSLCCTTRIVFSEGNWARSSSLWRKELAMQCSFFSFLTGFHFKSLRLVNSPVTPLQTHLLEQVTTETRGQGRDLMGWFPPAFFMLCTSAEMSGESLCH